MIGGQQCLCCLPTLKGLWSENNLSSMLMHKILEAKKNKNLFFHKSCACEHNMFKELYKISTRHTHTKTMQAYDSKMKTVQGKVKKQIKESIALNICQISIIQKTFIPCYHKSVPNVLLHAIPSRFMFTVEPHLITLCLKDYYLQLV